MTTFALAVCLFSFQQAPQDQPPPDVLKSVGSAADTFGFDTAYVFTAPLRPTPSGLLFFAGSAAIVTLAMSLDDEIRNFFQRNARPTADKVAHQVSRAIDGGRMVAVEAMFFIGACLSEDERLKRTAFEIMEASLIVEGITWGVKILAGRSRPSADRGSRDWSFAQGTGERRRSFPSGHVAISFTIAAVVADEYPDTAAGPVAYALAGAVAWARMEVDSHWASDVLTSAIFATIVGKTLVALHKNPERPQLVPWLAEVDGARVVGLQLVLGR